MTTIPLNTLTVGTRCLFQLSNWAPANLKFVEILFVGKKYVIMLNIDKDEEYCVTVDDHDCKINNRTPNFYISEER
jgi:hypothetical protein